MILTKLGSESRKHFRPRLQPKVLTTFATVLRIPRPLGLSAILLFVIFVLSNEQTCAADAINKPNVLFIAVDDLNDWVGCLGGHPQAKTPNIDKLASRGVLFEQAYCSSPLCNPSRMATMTGLRASSIGVWGNGGPYDRPGGYSWFRDKPEFKDWVTIPQYFRQHGYTAVTGGKIFHQAHGKFSDPVSWDHQYSTRSGTPFPKNGKRLPHGMSGKFTNNYYNDWADWLPLDISETKTADWKTAEAAAAFLQRDHDKPFFLACGIFRPHLRWYAPRKYFEMHPLKEVKLPVRLENDLDDVPPMGRRMAGQAFNVIHEHGEWKKAVQGYLASCSFADACVGVVLDALEKSGYAENTIVVLWGDHGFHIGEKNHISKLTLWEQGAKTPLIISAPDFAATRGKHCEQPVSLVDLYPTLVELCGLPSRDGLDGRSIAPLVRNPEAEWQHPAVINLRDNHAVRSQRWHYIRYADGGEELYDAKHDPHQWKNLAKDSRFADTKTRLRKWLPKTNTEQSHGEATRSKARQELRRSRDPKVLRNSATTKPDPHQKRPNVVILLADDLGSKDIGCYGGPVKTPTLDALAAKGVRFTDFHAGAAVCSPSRATLITGRQHLRTGIYGVLQDHMHNMHLLEREVTIPELLQQAGYGTAHFGKWHMGMTSGKRKKPSPTEHGFDYWFGVSNGAHPSHKDPVNFLRNGKHVGPLKGYSCQLIVDDAIRWLDRKEHPDQPFFLNLWFNEPHHKLAAPDEIVSLYGDLKDEAAIYSATVDNTDRAIGRLVSKLRAMGKLDNTLIIYSSDHGSYRTDRNGGLNGNKGSNFQGGLRSPGIFFWPDGIRGGRVEGTASGSVDLLPTICGLAGIDKPAGVHLDGADLSPLLTEKGKFQRTQPLIWLAPSSGHLATLREGSYTLMGYRGYDLPFDRERFNDVLRKMAELAAIDPTAPNLLSRVSNTSFSSLEFNRLNAERVRLQTFQEAWIPAIKAGGFSRFALYDLSTDPLQRNDIAKQRPEVVERLKKKLLELYKDVMADAPNWEPVVDAHADTSNTEKTSIEKKTRIHRLGTTKRSIFDAFSYLNRLPDKPFDDETSDEFGGRIFGRLANQEGRVLLKAPPGMDQQSYEGFKTFLRYEGTASVGNCSACHTLPGLSDGKSHIVDKDGMAIPTPSLRNVTKHQVDLRKVVLKKLKASQQKRSGEADSVSDEFSVMRLHEKDVSNLIAFLKLLDDVSDERFRELILEASVLGTIDD